MERRHYSQENWNARAYLDSSIVLKDDPTRKVYKIKDILRSQNNESDSLIVLTKNKEQFTRNYDDAILVPTPRQMEIILKDKQKYLEYLEDIKILEENFKLREKIE